MEQSGTEGRVEVTCSCRPGRASSGPTCQLVASLRAHSSEDPSWDPVSSFPSSAPWDRPNLRECRQWLKGLRVPRRKYHRCPSVLRVAAQEGQRSQPWGQWGLPLQLPIGVRVGLPRAVGSWPAQAFAQMWNWVGEDESWYPQGLPM